MRRLARACSKFLEPGPGCGDKTIFFHGIVERFLSISRATSSLGCLQVLRMLNTSSCQRRWSADVILSGLNHCSRFSGALSQSSKFQKWWKKRFISWQSSAEGGFSSSLFFNQNCSTLLHQAPPSSCSSPLSDLVPAARRKKVFGSKSVIEAILGGEGRPAPVVLEEKI